MLIFDVDDDHWMGEVLISQPEFGDGDAFIEENVVPNGLNDKLVIADSLELAKKVFWKE